MSGPEVVAVSAMSRIDEIYLSMSMSGVSGKVREDVPSGHGDGLGNRESNASSHIQEQEDVGDDSDSELYGIDDSEPGVC